MGTLLDQADFATKEGVLRKVRQAIIKTAIAVASEASSGVPALDASRLNFAATVLRDPDDGPRIMVYGIVTDDRIHEGVTDLVLTNIVSSLWNAYAGVNPNLSA